MSLFYDDEICYQFLARYYKYIYFTHFPIEVGRDHSFPLTTILTHVFRYHQLYHIFNTNIAIHRYCFMQNRRTLGHNLMRLSSKCLFTPDLNRSKLYLSRKQRTSLLCRKHKKGRSEELCANRNSPYSPHFQYTIVKSEYQ